MPSKPPKGPHPPRPPSKEPRPPLPFPQPPSRLPPAEAPTSPALPPEPSSSPTVFLDDERPTEPHGRTTRCPKCDGQGMVMTQDGTTYNSTRCDLCAGITKVPRATAMEWRVRNEPARKPR